MKTETGRLLYERAFLFLFVGNRIYDERPLFGLGKGYMEVFFLKKSHWKRRCLSRLKDLCVAA